MNKNKIKLHLCGLMLLAFVGACGQNESASVQNDVEERPSIVSANVVEMNNPEIPMRADASVISTTIVDEAPLAAPIAPLHPWFERMALDRSVPPWRAYQNHHDLLPSRFNDDEEFMFSFDLDPANIPKNMGWDDDHHHRRKH